MTRHCSLPATSSILLEIAMEAARASSPKCERSQREMLGAAWLSSLQFGDEDLSDDASHARAVDSVRLSLRDEPQEPDDPRMDPESIPSWRSSTPFGDAVDEQHARILRRTIDLLPGRLATLLRLRHGLGSLAPMSFVEIAEALAMTQEDVEAGVRSAMRLTRAGLLESQMRSTHGEDEAICQIRTRSPFATSIRRVPDFLAERVFAEGVIAGTHVLVDTPRKAAIRARAADASDRMDPVWLAREERRFQSVRAEKLATAARRRAALAAASAVATRAALDTPTLSIGLRPDEDEMRFAVYAFDGRGTDGGSSLLKGAFLTPSEMEMRYEDLKRDLVRYKDRKIGGRISRRVA